MFVYDNSSINILIRSLFKKYPVVLNHILVFSINKYVHNNV